MNWKKALAVVVVLAAAYLILRGGRLEPPEERVPETDLIRVISQGESVDLARHAGPEGWTIVEFTADW